MGDNFKVGLQKLGCGVMDWIDVALDRDRWRVFVNAAKNLEVS
jgi:ribosomal protein S4E